MGTRLAYAGCCRLARLLDEDGDWMGEEWLFDRPEPRSDPESWRAHALRLFTACPDVRLIDVEVIQTPARWGDPDCYLVRYRRDELLPPPEADTPAVVES